MRFYTYPETHQHYCGIDLHAKTMYLCILRRTPSTPEDRGRKTSGPRGGNECLRQRKRR